MREAIEKEYFSAVFFFEQVARGMANCTLSYRVQIRCDKIDIDDSLLFFVICILLSSWILYKIMLILLKGCGCVTVVSDHTLPFEESTRQNFEEQLIEEDTVEIVQVSNISHTSPKEITPPAYVDLHV